MSGPNIIKVNLTNPQRGVDLPAWAIFDDVNGSMLGAFAERTEAKLHVAWLRRQDELAADIVGLKLG